MDPLAPETCHELWAAAAPRRLAWQHNTLEAEQWRGRLQRCWLELLGAMPERVALDLRIESDEWRDGVRWRRLRFTSEAGAEVVGTLLVPTAVARPAVAICLQGHTTGHHISLGLARHEGDERRIAEGDRDFALQAVRQGYAAFAIEQRAFGERREQRDPRGHGDLGCKHPSMAALLLGRTMAGERVWDVMRACDVLEEFADEIDAERIACMGNSGGGTITWYAATCEPRIRAIMPSCSVCPWWESIGSIQHCTDNYLPRALQHCDMPDLAGLIAPRPAVIVSGRHDAIFPIAAVERGFATIRDIYRAFAAEQVCRLVIGDEGHRFYAAAAWPAFAELFPA